MLGYLARVGVGWGGGGAGAEPLSPGCLGAGLGCVYPGGAASARHSLRGWGGLCVVTVPNGLVRQERSVECFRQAVASWSPVSQVARWQWDESGKGGVDCSLQSLPSPRLALLSIITCPPLWWSWVSGGPPHQHPGQCQSSRKTR